MEILFTYRRDMGRVVVFEERTFNPEFLGADRDWVAHTFLATSPLQGNRRVVTPLLGFSWGFHIIDNKNIELKPLTSLTDVDWESHLSYLRNLFKEWQFTDMLKY